ncbi:MAG: TetR-like C-terminal domain-containing protein [Bacilli bacterium]
MFQRMKKKYIFSFFTCGILSIIKVWVDNDCKDDIELIISLITKLTETNDTQKDI